MISRINKPLFLSQNPLKFTLKSYPALEMADVQQGIVQQQLRKQKRPKSLVNFSRERLNKKVININNGKAVKVSVLVEKEIPPMIPGESREIPPMTSGTIQAANLRRDDEKNNADHI
jgi:hypothetical protein